MPQFQGDLVDFSNQQEPQFPMNTFLTRVELHRAHTRQEYDRFHQYMAAAKFRRTITGDDGIEYHLPTGLYYSFGDLTAEDVRHLASQAVAKIGHTAEIIVGATTSIAWQGLKKVQRALKPPFAVSNPLLPLTPSSFFTAPKTPSRLWWQE